MLSLIAYNASTGLTPLCAAARPRDHTRGFFFE